MPRLSNSRSLTVVAYLFSLTSFFLGANAIFNPTYALSFFGFDYPQAYSPNKTTIDALMLVYGIRDIYMGVAMLAAAWYGHSKIIGWLTLASGGIAAADGAICYALVGEGQWNHWSLLPVIIPVGITFLGGFDAK